MLITVPTCLHHVPCVVSPCSCVQVLRVTTLPNVTSMQYEFLGWHRTLESLVTQDVGTYYPTAISRHVSYTIPVRANRLLPDPTTVILRFYSFE